MTRILDGPQQRAPITPPPKSRPQQLKLEVRPRGRSAISKVLLVGGATRMPSVRRFITHMTGLVPEDKDVDPDEAVALGAAVQVRLGAWVWGAGAGAGRGEGWWREGGREG